MKERKEKEKSSKCILKLQRKSWIGYRLVESNRVNRIKSEWIYVERYIEQLKWKFLIINIKDLIKPST